MTDAGQLLDSVLAALGDQPRLTRLGTVDPGYDGGDPRVVWDGETAPTTKRYKALADVRADDRVVAVAAGSSWVVLGAIGDSPWEVGDYKFTSRESLGPRWVKADGGTFDAEEHPRLFAYLGTTDLPDWRDRIPAGAGGDFTLGATGGTKPTNVAEHNHSNTRATSDSDPTFASGSNRSAVGRITSTVANAGSTDAHGNYPPYRAVNVFIYAG